MAKSDEVHRLLELKENLVEYMQHKILDEDWHGVADAANDIREIDAQLSVLETWG